MTLLVLVYLQAVDGSDDVKDNEDWENDEWTEDDDFIDRKRKKRVTFIIL